MPDCEFAEIEYVGVGCQKVQGSRQSQEYQALTVITSKAAIYCHRADHVPARGVFTGGSVACCWFMVWRRHWQAQGATCWPLPSVMTAVPAIKDADFLCSVNEKSFFLSASKEGGSWELDSDAICKVI